MAGNGARDDAGDAAAGAAAGTAPRLRRAGQSAARRREADRAAFARAFADSAGEEGWTPKRRCAFLELLAATGNVARSASAMGQSSASAYALRRRDPAFATAWDDALAAAIDAVEGAMFEEAIHGGGSVAALRGRQFVLRARRPEVYGDKAGEAGRGAPDGLDAEAEEAELERRLAALAQRLGNPFGDEK